ncbi:MAG: hypothetical protein PHE33_06725 [Bacteroidales bacterium]|nr:hypothetical protein [Bacteroidales bacterium]
MSDGSVRKSGITRSVVYRTSVLQGLNILPEKKKDKAKKYEPEYLYMDATYLPN